jgi:hypothetical protein
MLPSRPLGLVFAALWGLTAGVAAAGPPLVYYQAADGHWRPLAARLDPQRALLTFSLDPARLRDGRTIIVPSPGPGVNLDDRTAPALFAAKLDGRALPAKSSDTDLDWLPSLPAELVVAVRDPENALLPASLAVSVNGHPLPAARVRLAFTGQDHRTARITAQVRDLLRQPPRLENRLELRIADAAPEAHYLTASWRFRHLGPVTADPLVLVDGCYAGYERLDVLTDGKLMTPGETTVGVSWASEEVPGDHWVVLAWPRARAVNQVRLHWAYYQSAYWTARKLVLQTWDGRGWVTRFQTADNPAGPETLVPLSSVTSSRLRVIQPDGGGNPAKGPNILWMDEIEVR